MMSGVCTRFPNLNHLEPTPIEQPSRRNILNLEVANHTLLLAWASLLSAYSGEEEEVAFLSNDGAIKIHLKTWRVESFDGINTTELSTKSITGLFFGKARKLHGSDENPLICL
jgi:hypothetical protein